MQVRETTARTIGEYVSIAGALGRSSAKRSELSARISSNKHRLYRDRDCIIALEAFLESAVRSGGVQLSDMK
jgi:protein O-GlcNAc transferase